MSESGSIDKRRHYRTDFFNDARVLWERDGANVVSNISDLSACGAFIETPEPPSVGNRLTIMLEAPGRPIRIQAIVRRSLEGRGMGVEFVDMPEEDRDRLAGLLKAAVVRRGRPPVPAKASPTAVVEPPPLAGAPRNTATPATSTPVARPPGDRRANIRYEMTATVNLTDLASGEPSTARLGNIGRTGCYLKTDRPIPVGAALRVALTKGTHSFEAEARVVYTLAEKGIGLVFTKIEPAELLKLNKLFSSHNEAIWVGDKRRKNQRIVLQVPVEVMLASAAKNREIEKTKTIIISPNGASLLLNMPVNVDDKIVLSNPRTRTGIECTVVYKGKTQEGANLIGVAFAESKQEFWRIAFPPNDWSARHADAKRNKPQEDAP